MRIFLLGVIFILSHHFAVNAQPGIYSEDDMKMQTIFMDAQTAKYQEKYEDQIALLNSLLELDRSCDACHYEIALAQFELKDYEKASKSIEKAISADPTNYGYNEAAIVICKENQEYSKALKYLQAIIKESPTDARLLEKAVFLANEDQKYDKALSFLDELDRLYGPYERTTKWKLDIFEKTNNQAGQLEAVEKLVKEFPDNTRFLNNLAAMNADFGNTKKAMEIWKRVIEIEPDNPDANFAILSSDVDSGSDQQFLSAIKPLLESNSVSLDDKIGALIPYVQKMNSDAADPQNIELLKVTDKLVRQYPNEAKVFALRGDVFYYLKNYTEADMDYGKTLSMNKGIKDVWFQKMINEIQLNDYQALLQTSNAAIDYFPLQFEPYFYNTIALLKAKKFSLADQQLEEASFIAAKNPLSQMKISILQAMKSFHESNYGETLDLLSDHSNTQDFILQELLGDAYANQGEIKKAVTAWNKAKSSGGGSQILLKKISEEKYIN